MHLVRSTSIPYTVNNKGPDARKSSAQHLDMLYNALVLFLNLHPCHYSAELIGIITALHNNFVIRLDDDPVKLISHYKNLRRWFIQYIRGNKELNDGFGAGEWDLTHGCPSDLSDLVAWHDAVIDDDSGVTVSERFRMFKVVISMLDGHRVIIIPAKPDYSTVDDPGVIKSFPGIPNVNKALGLMGITPSSFMTVYRAKCAAYKLRIRTTAGPNGQATWSAHADSEALTRSGLALDFCKYAADSKMGWLISAMFGTIEVPQHLSNTRSDLKPLLGRLHTIEEWGGKARIVAIVDYWTQALLEPLHQTINHFLGNWDPDGTFNQQKIINRVKGWTSDRSKTVYSYDLTAATDRLPLELQKGILGYLFGNTAMAENWAQLLGNRPFYCEDGVYRKYAVGQPMGALSSFPMLALTHHAIVLGCAIDANIEPYSDYVILGDDCSQTNEVVANKYHTYMTSIGVGINLKKSFVPVAHCAPVGEICKRVFVDGHELTALQPKLIVKAAKAGHLASVLQNELYNRGEPVNEGQLFNFFSGLIDKKSLAGLLVLNTVPTGVSGLIKPLPTRFANLDLARWFKGMPLTHQDLVQAFTYALVTEQLKRVDALLKGTTSIAELISAKVNADPSQVWPTGLYSGMTGPEKEAHIKKLPHLNPSHPIVLAAINEMQRVTDQLALLRSGKPEMVSAARRGLLDLLRNSLSEIWEGDSERKAAVQRSVFNSMLKILGRVHSNTETRDVQFSLQLTSVQRTWSVYWKLGESVRINMVTSSVKVSSADVANNLSDVGNKINFDNFRI